MTRYEQGDKVRITASFTDLDSNAADPTAVSVSVRTPNGVITAYTWADDEVKREAAGRFYYDLVLDSGGIYTYRWAGTGAVQAATPDTSIEVQSTIF